MEFRKFFPVFLIVFSVLCIVGSLMLENIQQEKNENTPQTIQSNGILFEIVNTEEKRTLGLSGRENIPHDYGMLFVFPEEKIYGFWMKDMKEPIDILWLADDGKILKIDADISPDTYPNSFRSPVPVRYVLEMKANEASRKAFIVDSTISLPLLK